MRNALTQDAPTLFMDQYGCTYRASSLKELKAEVNPYGNPHASKQYIDRKDGRTVWNGYVVGDRWCTAFKWAEVEQ